VVYGGVLVPFFFSNLRYCLWDAMSYDHEPNDGQVRVETSAIHAF